MVPASKTPEMREYHGTPLFAPEYAVLFTLEKMIKKIIPRVTCVDCATVGFVAENGHVTQLGLFYLSLGAIPESIGDLTSLKVLTLRANELLESVPSSIGGLTFLKEIYLEYNKLTTLPTSFRNLRQLEILDLTSNSLSILPDEIRGLESLQKLSIEFNQLIELPEWIGDLVSLRELNVHGNKLASIPANIGKLVRLNVLDIGGNNFPDITANIGNLTALHTLMLWGGKLAHLPETIGQLKSLEELQAHENEIHYLPESICRLSHLRRLSLDDNQLSSLPETIGNLSSLEHIGLSQNKLKSLPEALGRLSSLKDLFLENNQLTSLPEALVNLKNIERLDFQENKINQPLSNTLESWLTDLKKKKAWIKRPIPKEKPREKQAPAEEDEPFHESQKKMLSLYLRNIGFICLNHLWDASISRQMRLETIEPAKDGSGHSKNIPLPPLSSCKRIDFLGITHQYTANDGGGDDEDDDEGHSDSDSSNITSFITSQRSMVFDKKTIEWADLFVHLDRLEFYDGEIISHVPYKEDPQLTTSPSSLRHIERKEEENFTSMNEYAAILGIAPGYFKIGDDTFFRYDIDEGKFESLKTFNDVRKDICRSLENRNLIKLVTENDKVYFFDTTILDYLIRFGSELLKEKDFFWTVSDLSPPKRKPDIKTKVCPECKAKVIADLQECPFCKKKFTDPSK